MYHQFISNYELKNSRNIYVEEIIENDSSLMALYHVKPCVISNFVMCCGQHVCLKVKALSTVHVEFIRQH